MALSPRLWMNYTDVVSVLKQHGFDHHRLDQYSRTVTQGEVADACWLPTVRFHSGTRSEDVARVRPNSYHLFLTPQGRR